MHQHLQCQERNRSCRLSAFVTHEKKHHLMQWSMFTHWLSLHSSGVSGRWRSPLCASWYGADPWRGRHWTIVPLSHQQVSPWPFKGLASGTKKAERCCFKPLQALQILSCCFLTGPTQPGTACLTLWLLMSESTCSLRLSSLLPYPLLSLSLSGCHLSYLQQWVKMRG